MKRLALLTLAYAASVAYRRAFGVTQLPCWPPPEDAVTAADAQRAAEALGAQGGTPPHGTVLNFAWSTAATIEPWAEGTNFFPKILADVEAAESSVHILMFGWREGEIGMRMAELLERKLAEGVEVRVIVDAVGSKPQLNAKAMYESLRQAGAQVVINRFFPNFRADHRKLYVVDGRFAWTGGAGLEDHFHNGAFHDVMVRVTGDVVRQAQAAFLMSFRGLGGPLPADLSPLFPEQPEPGSIPIALAQVIPGGHVAASQAISEQIDEARERLDVMNPYFTDHDMVERLLAAARRGVKVRVVVSEKSNNLMATSALKYRYADLLSAGVEVWELPDAVVHAKIVVADDVVSFGTVNLDAWALYRNSEIMMIAKSSEASALMRERLFEPDIARAKPGQGPTGTQQELQSWVGNKLAHYL